MNQRSTWRCMLFLIAALTVWVSTGSADEAVPGPCCSEGCAKVCVRVPDVAKTPRTIYDCKCEDYCAPRCSLRALLGGLCGCSDTCCGPVRTRKTLLKKVVIDECPTTRCVVQQAPCDGACVLPK